MMNEICKNCHRLNNGCNGTENQAYTGCVNYLKKREIIDCHTQDVCFTKWVKRKMSMNYLLDVAEAKKYTGLTYRGLSAENPDYIVFSDDWSAEAEAKMKAAENYINKKVW